MDAQYLYNKILKETEILEAVSRYLSDPGCDRLEANKMILSCFDFSSSDIMETLKLNLIKYIDQIRKEEETRQFNVLLDFLMMILRNDYDLHE